MPKTKTVELESTEARMLAVALREYLNEGSRNGLGRDTCLRDHPTSKAVIEDILKRVEVDEVAGG